jgi:D-glycero-alpha-D-manno-heptose 1-phosphate guanylyltransferase
MSLSKTEQCLVLNGDSFFDLPIAEFIAGFNLSKADAAIALRHVEDTSRYGAITTDDQHLVRSFSEKSAVAKPGFINAGVYLLCRSKFLAATPEAQPFSIEHDYFSAQASKLTIFGFPHEGYFIDIGIPQDYQKAQDDFKRFKY